jgi:tetratricopeptide (TPR) repeat protein
VATALTGLAAAAARRGDPQAEALYFEALAILKKKLPGSPPNPRLAATLLPYGTYLCAKTSAQEALPFLEEARRIRREVYGAADYRYAEASAAFGSCLASAGRLTEGIAALEESARVFEATSDHRLPGTLEALANAWEHTGNEQEAARLRARLVRSRTAG